MKLIIHDKDQKFEELIRKRFGNNGEELNIFTDDGTIHNCVGCFHCWIKTPTECMWKDNYSHMSKAMGDADELILISRCCYGTYSPFVRNVLDRSLSYIHPDFTKRNHEIHHKTRYTNRMKTSAYFYGDITPEEKETAKKVVKANIINFNGIYKGIYFMQEAEDILNETEAE